MSINTITQQIIDDPANIQFKRNNWPPLFVVNPLAKILIIGQAPGLKTQLEGALFHDESGKILRTWLGVSEEDFYNAQNFAILPLDFYFPGSGPTGDLPPRPFIYEKYHRPLLALMPNIKLTIVIGTYAQKIYLDTKQTLTNVVKDYKSYLPTYFPLPHPSPRNFRWHLKNPWFKEKVVAHLQQLATSLLQQ